MVHMNEYQLLVLIPYFYLPTWHPQCEVNPSIHLLCVKLSKSFALTTLYDLLD